MARSSDCCWPGAWANGSYGAGAWLTPAQPCHGPHPSKFRSEFVAQFGSFAGGASCRSSPQKRGAGVRNSTPTRCRSAGSPKYTTRHSCSSCVSGCVSTSISPSSISCLSRISAPCAFTTTVSHVSRNFRPLCARPCACNFIFRKARPLRRCDLEATVSMLPCSSPPRPPVNCPQVQMFPTCNSQLVQHVILKLPLFHRKASAAALSVNFLDANLPSDYAFALVPGRPPTKPFCEALWHVPCGPAVFQFTLFQTAIRVGLLPSLK